jgi:hypothetical protein
MTAYSELAPVCAEAEESAYSGRGESEQRHVFTAKQAQPKYLGACKETRRLRRATIWRSGCTFIRPQDKEPISAIPQDREVI